MIAKSIQKDLDRAMTELNVRDPLRRGNAVANVGVFGGPEVLPAVKKALADESEYVRVSALYSMVLLGDKDSVVKLIPYVSHARDHFRKLALASLEAATGQKHGGPHDDEAACKTAQGAWEKWWTANAGTLAWNANKRVWKS
ncbi:MAG: HEAT repeat domain-containing protein [Planctomycetes bacterium]|nr:HEAT repeat domain-containing protein [Planctomycetota bacterium]